MRRWGPKEPRMGLPFSEVPDLNTTKGGVPKTSLATKLWPQLHQKYG